MKNGWDCDNWDCIKTHLLAFLVQEGVVQSWWLVECLAVQLMELGAVRLWFCLRSWGHTFSVRVLYNMYTFLRGTPLACQWMWTCLIGTLAAFPICLPGRVHFVPGGECQVSVLTIDFSTKKRETHVSKFRPFQYQECNKNLVDKGNKNMRKPTKMWMVLTMVGYRDRI